MITKLETSRKFYDFLVYDLEWMPHEMRLRLVGVFDGIRYRCYDSVSRFLVCELTNKNRGKRFYAHAGGLADVTFILEELQKHPEFSCRACFSGSSAILVDVRRGNNVWYFVDSLWLLRDSLRNIGKYIGLEKGGEEDNKEIFYGPLEILIPYNERDCVILWKAIMAFQESLLQMGGELKTTLASCAMNLFRRKYLTKDVHTSKNINGFAKEAYFASRVEVFNRYCENANYYDINSSFPYSMTKPCPGSLLKSNLSLDSEMYIADVTIKVDDTYAPPMPYRLKGRIFFPLGDWRQTLTNVDIELLLKSGGKILKVHEVLHFEPFHDLAEYAKNLYEKRKHSEGMEKVVYKLLLNSLYGKFAESCEKSSLLLNPRNNPMLDDSKVCVDMLFPGAYIVEEMADVPHAHFPIAAHITSLSRRSLYQFLNLTGDFYYCDTDGFATTDRYEESNELGGLKLEKEIKQGVFVLPKLYRIDDKVKAKGFSRITPEKFERLISFHEIEYERMTRIRELYRKGIITPQESIIKKQLNKNAFQKRFMYPDGQTRPWNIKELHENLSRL